MRPYWLKFGMFGPVFGILSTIVLVILFANAPSFTPWGASGAEALMGNPVLWILFFIFFIISSLFFFALLAVVGFIVGKIKTERRDLAN